MCTNLYSTVGRGKCGVPTGTLQSAGVSYVYPLVLYSHIGKLGVSTGIL